MLPNAYDRGHLVEAWLARRRWRNAHPDRRRDVCHAVAIAMAVKEARAKGDAKTVHLFIAAPAAFAVLLGAELNALCAELVLHEHAGERDAYMETLTINAR